MTIDNLETLPAETSEALQIAIQKGDRYQRFLSVRMQLPYAIEPVWRVITDYDGLADFIPNLVKSHRWQQPNYTTHLELVGYCRVLNFHLSARMVLQVEEQAPYLLRTRMIEGDLRHYSGQWQLQEIQHPTRQTLLHYSAEIVPKLTLPIDLVERQLHRLLPINFLAIRQRLDSLHR